MADPSRNLVTVGEFAVALGIGESSVYELLKKGLPSIKTLGIGRRIKKAEAEAWLVAGGASRSRVARRIAGGRRG